MTAEALQETVRRARRVAAQPPPPRGAKGAAAADDAPPRPFTRVDLAGLIDAPPAPTSFWWDGLVPAGAVTLLGAHGDTGKSMVSLMLACSLCAGEPLFGIATRRARVAYFSAEDPARVVLLRLHGIVKGLGLMLADLDDLHVLDATEGDPVLFHELSKVDGRPGVITPSYTSLREYLDAEAIDVLIVDNASDVFDASENDRAKVRAFMRALTQLAQPERAVVLLSHVNRSTASGFDGSSSGKAEGYSGSTAWHNSARSRLYLRREKDGGLVLEHHKNNLGQGKRDPIQLSWPRGGLPQLDKPVESVVQHIADSADTKGLLKVLHEFYGREKFVSSSQFSPANAARLLAQEPGYPRRKKPAEVFALLNEAERRGLIEVQSYKTKDRKDRERWGLTAKGCDFIGAPAPTAPTAPTSEVCAFPEAGAGGAPTAPTCGAGGVGGLARAQDGEGGSRDAG